MTELIERIAGDAEHPAAQLVELGLHHEQQHQELLLTDIKHVFWMNPLRPAYGPHIGLSPQRGATRWLQLDEGVRHIGHAGDRFSYDNETPRHRVFLEPFSLASRLVTNGEYLAFIEDGGYTRPELWLSAGLAVVQDRGWFAPLYWERDADGWSEFTLEGTRPLSGAAIDEPVCHVSFYEADAFARWSSARLPTEFEWEAAAAERPQRLQGLFDAVWQWTNSAYVGYPGYAPAPGAIGEYNGKWMVDQWVLRGSSCATSPGHSRHTYRNFFPSDTRWQFTGIRLARSAGARR
jgi:ergothioneine biosynthesis protein EgtB